jgi:hypothetical protein
VAKALKLGIPVEDLADAMRGIASYPERGEDGRVHDWPITALRDNGARVARYAQLWRNPPRGRLAPRTQQLVNMAERFVNGPDPFEGGL